jgi:putative oxidoreductase
VIYLLRIELVGISRRSSCSATGCSAPHGAPTLQGQYVLKDVILVTAVLVIAATVRGGKMS